MGVQSGQSVETWQVHPAVCPLEAHLRRGASGHAVDS